MMCNEQHTVIAKLTVMSFTDKESFGSGTQWSAAIVCWRTNASNVSYCCWQDTIRIYSKVIALPDMEILV